MDAIVGVHNRRPRYRRVEPPPFRLTDADVDIIRVVGRHRLSRSVDIAALVGRSLDRTNDRLFRLFHAGYVDRPRAQLDRFPTDGTASMVYALADKGARLLREQDGVQFRNMELSRKNREAGRPFIEHQIAIVNFEVALQRAVAPRSDVRLITSQVMSAASRQPVRPGAPLALRAKLSHRGWVREVGVIPDLVFGLQLANGKQLNFMAEIDRGTMPVRRSDPDRTSFEQKMRVYLAAHAAKQPGRQFGWKNFRVLTITTDRDRLHTMQSAARDLTVSRGIGPSLFLFATFADLRATSPLDHTWLDGTGRPAGLF